MKPKKQPLILVIDDEESMRDSCCLILAKEGFRTAEAEDGKIGIRHVEDLGPDLVLVDLKMPGISGLEVLQQIKDIDEGIISIVITGYATVESAVEAMKKGAYDFLPKPFTPEELRIIIKRGLEHRRLMQETESLRREKKLMEDNFITMVSHQLRSPVAAVMQYFEVILSGLIKDESQKNQMLLKARIRLEGLLELINDWLDIARMNSGQIVSNRKPIPVIPLLSRLMDFYKPQAAENGLSLTVEPVKGSDIVCGDDESLEQVFSNLITNAVKYNRPGGRISISVEEEKSSIAVRISDTGIGIPAEHLPYIFDQFYRVPKASKKKIRGSGLGLSIAKKIIEAHDGLLTVSSSPDKGSTFCVRLPKGKPAADN
jgi:two-component system sensor histidine kinase/response regulator